MFLIINILSRVPQHSGKWRLSLLEAERTGREVRAAMWMCKIRHRRETSRGDKAGGDFLLRQRNSTTGEGRRSWTLETAVETSTAAEESDIRGGREEDEEEERGIRETAPSELLIAKSSNSPMPPLQLLLAVITSVHYPRSRSQHSALNRLGLTCPRIIALPWKRVFNRALPEMLRPCVKLANGHQTGATKVYGTHVLAPRANAVTSRLKSYTNSPSRPLWGGVGGVVGFCPQWA